MRRSETLALELEPDEPLASTGDSDVADDRSVEEGGPHPVLLVGDVLDSASAECPGRVLVRWRAFDGTLAEHWLYAVRGLFLKKGDTVLLQRPGNWPAWLITHALSNGAEAPGPQEEDFGRTGENSLDVIANGKRIEIEGQDEVVLRCGKASITLRGDGRVVIRGKYVESRSEGTNRIKGGTVLIN